MNVVIIGNGIAGTTVAQELSTKMEGAHVTLVAREEYLFYSRIKLPEVVAGNIPPMSTVMYPAAWYEGKNIDVKLSSSITSIDPKAKTVTLYNHEVLPYDILVLATGCNPNRLDCEGSNLAGIHTLRTLDDAISLRADLLAHASEPVVVIGGGLLGLEAAMGMKSCVPGHVGVLEFAPYLLSRQLDQSAAKLLTDHLQTLGLDIVTSACTQAFYDEGDGRVGAIKLADGRTIKARTVLLSLGVSPEVFLAQKAGIATNRGIIVNEKLQTTYTDIYAVGDCAEFGGRCWGIVPAALEQAQTAARVIRGEDVTYDGTVPSTMLKVAGIEAVSLGQISISAEEQASGEWHTKSHSDGGRYECFFLQGEVLRGAVLYGSKAHMAIVRKLIGTSVDAAEIQKLLTF